MIDPSFPRRPESSVFRETLNKSFDQAQDERQASDFVVVSLSNQTKSTCFIFF